MSGIPIYYHRINANIFEPSVEAWDEDFNTVDEQCCIQSLLTHSHADSDGMWKNGNEMLLTECYT